MVNFITGEEPNTGCNCKLHLQHVNRIYTLYFKVRVWIYVRKSKENFFLDNKSGNINFGKKVPGQTFTGNKSHEF